MLDKDDPLYTGTFWEFKNSDGGVNRASASLAHGWAASPTVQLTQYLLGITAEGPGYQEWAVAPSTGGLRWARGVVPTESGTLSSRWRSQPRAGRFTLVVNAPSGTRGTITVPFEAGSRVIVQGPKGTGRAQPRELRRAAADGEFTLQVPGGRYRIQVRGR